MDLNNSSYVNETWTPWTPGLPRHTRITLWSILLVCSLLGNLLVIAVVYCNKNLRTNMNYLIVNMAVSDLLVPLIALPWRISSEKGRFLEWLVEGPLGEALCKLVPFLSDISPTVSSLSIVVITVQRFIFVVYPIQVQNLSRKTRWITMSFTWIVGLILLSPELYEYHLTKEWGYTICHYHWPPAFKYKTAQIIFFGIFTLVSLVIPLITIIVLYSLIFHKLRTNLKNIRELIKRQEIRSRQRTNRRIFRMSISVIITLTIGWTPRTMLYLLWLYYRIDYYLKVFNNNFDMSENAEFTSEYLFYAQTAINPCIYFVFLRDFQQGLKTFCCRTTASKSKQITPRRPKTPNEDSNPNPTCTPPHINTTSV